MGRRPDWPCSFVSPGPSASLVLRFTSPQLPGSAESGMTHLCFRISPFALVVYSPLQLGHSTVGMQSVVQSEGSTRREEDTGGVVVTGVRGAVDASEPLRLAVRSRLRWLLLRSRTVEAEFLLLASLIKLAAASIFAVTGVHV
eukprot:CAMPEP_0174729986 /NCGR_PEP_ID=MMETSP1094-20130205/54691_1 /TAXON_ID=156173 /ORGANISM="Chrysochromulina brevifilum, Strain UTEX LB 985" /LENGTH=142 /DNA_ID=CAMNT_0015932169 /DNA_START=305 /DNA_END=733 /DNA_ORIENTATION=+